MSKSRFLRTFALLSLLVTGLIGAGVAVAAKPEDVFKGKIDKIWPTEEKGPEQGTWNLEYAAFFAQPLNDSEIQVKFYDITGGEKRYVAGDPQYTRDRNSRVFVSSIQLDKPAFDVRKHYLMTLESRSHVIASTQFWLLGKGANYSGKVEFSDAEAKGK